MSFDRSILGPYSSPPNWDDPNINSAIAAFLPENISGLSWVRPNLAVDGHVIVRTFAIDRKKRPGGELIHCAMCSARHPKFLQGSLLWSPDQWLRLIGHKCARKDDHFGEARYRRLRQAQKQKQLDKAGLDWCEAYLPLVRPLLVDLPAIRTALKFLEDQQRQFFKGVSTLASYLEARAARHGGVITVAETRSARQQEIAEAAISQMSFRSDASRFAERSIGTIQGLSFLTGHRNARYSMLDKITSVEAALSRVPMGEGQQPLYELFDGGEQRVNETAILALTAIRNGIILANHYEEASRFVRPENIALLERWGSHRDAPIPLSIVRGRRHLTFRLSADLNRANLDVEWPTLPDLTAWRRLAATGNHLDQATKGQSP